MKPISESARARALRLARLAALADRLAVAELARVDRELAAALKTGGPEKPAPDPLRVAGQSAAPATPPAPPGASRRRAPARPRSVSRSPGLLPATADHPCVRRKKG